MESTPEEEANESSEIRNDKILIKVILINDIPYIWDADGKLSKYVKVS